MTSPVFDLDPEYVEEYVQSSNEDECIESAKGIFEWCGIGIFFLFATVLTFFIFPPLAIIPAIGCIISAIIIGFGVLSFGIHFITSIYNAIKS